MFKLKSILHPTDFSPLSHKAYELACSMAMQNGARVILLHVEVTPPPTAPPPYGAAGIHSEKSDEEDSRRQLDELRSANPNITMEYVLERGSPSEEILRIAEETNCDAIVMGTHGRSGLTRLLMGSVAEKVLREAPCPVVTISEPVREEAGVDEKESAGVSS